MAISVSAYNNFRLREIRDHQKVDTRQTTGELQLLRARQKSETGGLEQYLETSKPTLVKQFDGEGGEFGRNHKNILRQASLTLKKVLASMLKHCGGLA